MGFGLGKLKKAIGGVVKAVPIVSNIAEKIPVVNTLTQSATRTENLQKQSLLNNELQQEQLAQLAQEKAVASESVRLQEEEARKRTLFAGTALGETSERKKLLGL
jgi:hypothetical protein